MKKWTLIEETLSPDGSHVSLCFHDGDYTIRVNGVDLMSTREHASEEYLGKIACEKLGEGARVLIGGLGFGYTLKATLADLPPGGKVVVAELLETVIRWNQDPRFPLAAKALKDKRVRCLQRDVLEVLEENPSGFDRILLDVDNGPAALTTQGNRSLYQENGLRRVYDALKDGGVAAFWSSVQDPRFVRALQKVHFTASAHPCRSRGTKGAVHTIYLGKKPLGNASKRRKKR